MIAAGLLTLLFVFLYGVYLLTNTAPNYKEIMTITSDDHVKWSSERKHVLIEYSDLQCPACKLYHEMLSSFEASGSPQAAIPKKVTLVYRHFPLYQIHENALQMAYGAEGSSKQGKFFEFVTALFADQDNLSKTKDPKTYLVDKAKAAGLNIEQFKKDMDSQYVKDKITSDLSGGERAGINGTPTFFLDGQKLEFKSPQEFVKILQNIQ